jgi:ABC-type transport system involved in multi-copper enzyme maturation permease subunit
MFGPLFVKELLEMARRRRYFLVRVLIGAALLLGWWIGLNDQNWTIHYRSLGNLSTIGESMFRWWAYLSLWGVVILTPLLVGGLIAAEKDGRTFETLLTTLLTNREILIGKAASRLLLLSILIASSVPILAVASLYGGFDVKQVLTAAAVIGSTCLFVVVVALYYSTITYKPYVAMLRTYFFLAVLWWLLPVATVALDMWPVRTPWQLMSIANGDETYYAGRAMRWRFGGVSSLQFAPKTGMLASIIQENTLYLVLAALFHAAIAAILYWRSNFLLRRRLQAGKPPWFFTVAVKIYHAMVSGARKSVEARKHSTFWSRLWSAEETTERWWRQGLERTIDRNPLLYRNRVANAFDPEHFVAAIQLLIGLGAIAAFLMLGWQERVGVLIVNQLERIGLWALVGVAILFLTCSAILAAGAFARERQYGSWEVLMLTDLPPVRHLTASLVGVLGTLRLLLFILLALAVIVGYVFSGFLPVFVWSLAVAALWLLVVAYSLFTSLFHRRIATALPATLIGLMVLLIFPAGIVARDPAFFARSQWVVAALAAAAVSMYWLARHGFVSWFAFHAAFTLSLLGFMAMFLAGDVNEYQSGGLKRVGEYYFDRRANSPATLLTFPLGWGRRFAYGLMERIPDVRGAISFLITATATVVTFLATFRTLSAAEPTDRIRQRRSQPRSNAAQSIG